MNRTTFTIFFLIVGCADLYQVYYGGDRLVTKSLIMVSLIAYYLSHYSSILEKKPKLLFLIALFAALAGDTFLQFEGCFLYGLSSFLIMQLLYSYCFWRDRSVKRNSYGYGLMLLVIIAAVAAFLWPDLGNLKVPVVIYMTAIGLMSFTAHNRNGDLPGYGWVFAGTLLFIISDSVLAVHQFDTGVHLGKLTVMMTYIAAQYFIVLGYLDGAIETLK